MPQDVPSRSIGELTYPDISKRLRASSILCLPIGSIEQHGPHLPLNTDVVLAEEFTRRIIARWGDTYDLWQLPTQAISLAREHEWAPGTLSLSIEGMIRLIRDLDEPFLYKSEKTAAGSAEANPFPLTEYRERLEAGSR